VLHCWYCVYEIDVLDWVTFGGGALADALTAAGVADVASFDYHHDHSCPPSLRNVAHCATMSEICS
jgi:hypothetical protein